MGGERRRTGYGGHELRSGILERKTELAKWHAQTWHTEALFHHSQPSWAGTAITQEVAFVPGPAQVQTASFRAHPAPEVPLILQSLASSLAVCGFQVRTVRF